VSNLKSKNKDNSKSAPCVRDPLKIQYYRPGIEQELSQLAVSTEPKFVLVPRDIKPDGGLRRSTSPMRRNKSSPTGRTHNCFTAKLKLQTVPEFNLDSIFPFAGARTKSATAFLLKIRFV
jgi:hypothetical protein